MANICYNALVLANQKDLIKIVNTIENKFDDDYDINFKRLGENAADELEEIGFDYTGFVYENGKYIVRFETKWAASESVVAYLSKQVENPVAHYFYESGAGFYGWVIYKNGVNQDTFFKDDYTDITDEPELIKTIMITDWAGLAWESWHSEDNGEVTITMRHGTGVAIVTAMKYVDSIGVQTYLDWVHEFGPRCFAERLKESIKDAEESLKTAVSVKA